MIINEHAGSGGDALPYYFRDRKIGPLVGTRTWGGLVGIYDYPALIDGGSVTAPRVAFFNNQGKWEVENEGVPPDIEVEQLPAKTVNGGDPQLRKEYGYSVSRSVESLRIDVRRMGSRKPLHGCRIPEGRAALDFTLGVEEE